MTEAELTETATARPRTKLWSWVGATVVVVAAVTVALVIVIGAAVEDEGYGPIEGAGGFGLSGPGVTYRDPNDTGFPRLGHGAAYSLSMLTNAGRHPVRVTSVDDDVVVHGAQWAPWNAGPDVFGMPKQWRDFPATIPADRTIQVRVKVVRPGYCHGRLPSADGGIPYDGHYTFRWRSRRSTHATEYPGEFGDSLLLC